ncbi:MAG TPA: hypothetical protein VNG53_02435 [Bacteroidia bacterium]|nr:hypothetical protein [Bacteroidia bacterium]
MIVQTQNPFKQKEISTEQDETSTDENSENNGFNIFLIGLSVLVVGFLIFKFLKNIKDNVFNNL